MPIIFCCNKEKEKLNRILENGCFWDFWDRKETLLPNSGYKFKSNGECQYFEYKFQNQKRTDTLTIFKEEDVFRDKVWTVIGDTILVAQGFKSKIIKFNKDTIVGKYINSLDTFLLIRNCKVVSLSKYW